MKGFLLIDKRKGETSFDVIRQLRKLTGVKKMGHAGTLDPLATGLLIVAVGEGTKLLQYFIGKDKCYEAEAKFGEVSDSYDADGSIRSFSDAIVTKEDLEKVINESFIGQIEQVPPKYSALKINGQKAYDLARKGEDFEMKKREIIVNDYDIVDFDWPIVKFKINCGSGTYIRSLIHDLGQSLKVGAYIKNLRRISVGKFSVQEAIALGSLSKNIEHFLLPLEDVLSDFESVELSSEDMSALADGCTLLGKKIEQKFAMGIHEGELVGVLKNCEDGIRFSRIIH